MLASGPKAAGHKVWYFGDGFLPSTQKGPFVSHESVCILNTGGNDAQIRLDFYFEDRAPIKDLAVVIPAERTIHVRLDQIRQADGSLLPRDLPYAIRVRSSVPVIAQHTRLDVSQPELALMTTVGWPED